ncbi:uncharacterized protein LOC141855607 isoform X3 [Brevipalpus obovatus]|uniref:uncharacterized protein LOC141855607 isoform X3 n=1 Tax=Brevipalpus obovatus TaxID=246614 RepID=UPI003D9EAEA8
MMNFIQLKMILPKAFIVFSMCILSTISKEDRFSNFYSQPENLKLIAMASEFEPRHHRQPRERPRSLPPSESSDEPRFSIGLGTLAPSYSQKFGVDGRTRLDFNHRKDGFSYSLSNNHHPEPSSQEGQSGYGYDSQESKDSSNVHRFFQPPNRRSPNINERFIPQTQNAETRQFFTRMVGPRDGHGSTHGRDLIPNQERFQELVDQLAPKMNDGQGFQGFSESSENDFSGPSMNSRGFSYHGGAPAMRSQGGGYRPYQGQPVRGPSPPPPPFGGHQQRQAPYQAPPPPPTDRYRSQEGFDSAGASGFGGFSDNPSFEDSFGADPEGGFQSYNEEMNIPQFQENSDKMPQAFEYSSTVSAAPVMRSENINSVYLTPVNQFGYNDGLITDQQTLNTILSLGL